MPRDGTNGQYTLPPSNPVSPDTVIESVWANTTMSDIANALTASLTADGQTTASGNQPMGGFRHTNVSDPNQRNQYSTLGMVQDGLHQRIQGLTGVDNLTGTLVGGATSYVAGALVSFYAPATNTGPMTLGYNGIGAKSLLTNDGQAISAGEITANDFIMALYNGTAFTVLNAISTAAPPEIFAVKTSGQNRPVSGTFQALTIATATSIIVPAGTAWVIPPNTTSADDAVQVSWQNQTVSLLFLATAFSTTVVVDSLGNIQQIAGRAVGASFRNYAILGVVEHLTGVANKVITRPAIFGDDTYKGTDTSAVLTNYLISGGLVSPNGTNPMHLDISEGMIFMPGGSANTIDSPNVFPVAQQFALSFRTLAGQQTVGALIQAAPVTQYDPNGAGVVTVIPNNADTVVHRLYSLYGTYVWVYGQYIYTSVENANSLLEFDRTRYKPSLFLNDAVLVAEIISTKNSASLANVATSTIIAPGGINFSIGSSGGISEAPINGTPYGRQDAAWVSVLGATSPQMLVNAKVTGTAPKIDQVMSPYAPGTIAHNFYANALQWASIEVANPDDKMYIRSFNPNNGNLRFSTIFDLATGAWTFPGGLTAVSFTGSGAALTNVNHANLTNLTTGDPHTQYLTQARGDARYPLRDANFTQFAVVAALPGTPDPNTIYFIV
jgi:hypothetical protein